MKNFRVQSVKILFNGKNYNLNEIPSKTKQILQLKIANKVYNAKKEQTTMPVTIKYNDTTIDFIFPESSHYVNEKILDYQRMIDVIKSDEIKDLEIISI